MAAFLTMPDISKKVTPTLLLPPEVIWNLSRLSKHLMLSWTSSEEGDHASISLMFDKTQPSKYSPRVPNVLPTLPSLPTPRVPEESLFSELIDMNMDDIRGSSERPLTPVRPKLHSTKPDRPVRVKREPGIVIKQEKVSPVLLQKDRVAVPFLPHTRPRIPPPAHTSAPMQVEETEPRQQEIPKELSRVVMIDAAPQVTTTTSRNTTVTKVKSAQDLGTKERIDALLKSCRSQTDGLAVPLNTQTLLPVQTSTPIQEHAHKPLSLVKPSSDTTVLTEQAPNTPSKRSYKKVVSKKPAYHREAASIKATVYPKDSRKRKVFRKTPLRPSKRRTLTCKMDSDTSDGSDPEYEIGSSAASQRHDVRGRDKRADVKNIMTVKECVMKIKKHISYRHLSRANHRDVRYEICDGETSFYLKCYKNGNKDPLLYKDITLQWLERNALQVPVYIMQQSALRLLYKFLKGRPANDAVPRKERELLMSLV